MEIAIAAAGLLVCLKGKEAKARLYRAGAWFFGLFILGEIIALLLGTVILHQILLPIVPSSYINWVGLGISLPGQVIKWISLAILVRGFYLELQIGSETKPG